MSFMDVCENVPVFLCVSFQRVGIGGDFSTYYSLIFTRYPLFFLVTPYSFTPYSKYTGNFCKKISETVVFGDHLPISR